MSDEEKGSAREDIVEYLERTLVGPGLGVPDCSAGYERETVEGRLTLAYMLGMLYPRQLPEDAALGRDGESSDDTRDAGVDRDVDDPLSMANALLPASMGLTFCVDQPTTVSVKVSAARYERSKESDGERWTRNPLPTDTRVLQAAQGPIEDDVLGGLAKLSVLPRRGSNGTHLITVSVSNSATASRTDPSKNLYQVRIEVSTRDIPIREYPKTAYMPPTDEERELLVVYRGQRTYAVGHGISADWTLDSNGECRYVCTQPIPRAHVWRPVFDRLEIDDLEEIVTFGKNELFVIADLGWGTAQRTELVSRLEALVKFYELWIESQRGLLVPDEYQQDARRITDRCATSAARMREGLRLLAEDDTAFRSFQLANRAMLMSMCHQRRILGESRVDGKQGPYELGEADTAAIDYRSQTSAKWRPFQLAFLLQILPSLCDDEHPDRDAVDVIWFATGGGKTEAYLLAAAFELIRRRLVHGGNGIGVGVINRYTYRFLTADQFQRTAAMICALELLRRHVAASGDTSLGDAPFSVGLFAGASVSPNRFTSQDGGGHQLRVKLDESTNPRAENPFPLESCPSCGTLLAPTHSRRHPDGSVDRSFYGFDSSATSFAVHCPEESCDFHDEIPAYFIDEQLYSNQPSFLLGTIDKFAMVPWDERAGCLFGTDVPNAPPSLIIQDELHLISGPLGTLAGIYEAAFEVLIRCAGGNAPKIVAATATIRNAANQCRRIYGREGIVFPSPGVRAEDSFFSRLDAGNKERSRLYIGLMGPGLRSTVAVSWAIAAILQAVRELSLDDKMTPEEVDSYWTLVAYHNSKRELGRISNATRDEIPARLKVYARTQDSERPSNFHVLELHAHSDTPIPVARQELHRRHSTEAPAIDIVPCTNIISVGVDIERLGLMLVNGQPKLTAEYIQASSRVGRGGVPGVVITCYSPSKPRDRSHYEGFRDFHERFYSFVEPTSVTPGSLPALERALHAALLTVVRHGAGLKNNRDATRFDVSDDKINQVVTMLLARMQASYSATDEREVQDRIASHLGDLCQQWSDWIRDHPHLCYRSAPKQQRTTLMTRFEDPRHNNVGWPTLQSMRHVDTEIALEAASS